MPSQIRTRRWTWSARGCRRWDWGSWCSASCGPGHGGSSTPSPTRRSGRGCHPWCGWWRRGRSALIDPAMLRIPGLQKGLSAFFFQFLIQAGLFFCVPLYLSVALGLSAIDTGLRILPLSVTLLLSAVGVPRVFPNASPRRLVRIGFLALLAGILSLLGALDLGTGPEVVTGPLLLAGLGIGALSSQLGAVTVSAVPDEQSGEVGGIQNTFTNLGASIGTALAGAVLI